MLRTYEKLRIGIVVITIFFLFTLWYYRNVVKVDKQARHSISAYFHQDNLDWRMRDIMVASLGAVGVMLIVYQGYTRAENGALTVAGAALIGVAAFPMDWPVVPGAKPKPTALVHYICALTFFSGIAYVCLWESKRTLILLQSVRARQWLGYLYSVIGWSMIILPVSSILTYYFGSEEWVYRAEYAGVSVFLVYWIVKSIELRLPDNTGNLPPMPPLTTTERAQWTSATCAIITAIVAIFGVYSYYYSSEKDRIKDAQDAVARIYTMDSALVQCELNDPRLRRLLREDSNGDALRDAITKDPLLEPKFKAMCALTGNLFEYYILIKNNIGAHPQSDEIIKAWEGYITDVFDKSSGFRQFIKDTKSVWSDTLFQELAKYEARQKAKQSKTN